MAKLHDDSRGVTNILVIILIIALAYGVYVLFLKNDSQQGANVQEASNSETSEVSQSADENSHQTVISLQPVNGYSARGKVTIVEDRFGLFSLQLSAALPSEFESTYYEAHLEGDRTIDLGRLTREGGTYKVNYSSNETIDMFDKIVITVDGDAATVEGKTLPHDVMVGGLQ